MYVTNLCVYVRTCLSRRADIQMYVARCISVCQRCTDMQTWHVYTYIYIYGVTTISRLLTNLYPYVKIYRYADMGWLRLVGSLKLQVSFAEYRLYHRALLQKRPII